MIPITFLLGNYFCGFRTLITNMLYFSIFPQRHNVSNSCVQSSEFSSLLDMLEISDNIVANFVIDQCEPENTLLLPTSDDAYRLGDVQNVPRNCRRAYTLPGDFFQPAPNYRTYSGNVQRRKFLQVSTSEIIQ